MELKGEIPLSEETRTEAINFRTFFVHTVNFLFNLIFLMNIVKIYLFKCLIFLSLSEHIIFSTQVEVLKIGALKLMK